MTRAHLFLSLLLFSTLSFSVEGRHNGGASVRPGLLKENCTSSYGPNPSLTQLVECDLWTYVAIDADPTGPEETILQLCYDHNIGCDDVLLLDACTLLRPVTLLQGNPVETNLVCDLFPAHDVQMEYLRVLKDEFDIHDGEDEEEDQPIADPLPFPISNECSSAPVLPIPTTGLQGTTLYATVSYDILGMRGIDSTGPSVWYTFVGTGDTVSVTLDCSGWNASVRVMAMNHCHEYAGQYSGRGNQCVDGVRSPQVETVAGQPYAVLIEGYLCPGGCGPGIGPEGIHKMEVSQPS